MQVSEGESKDWKTRGRTQEGHCFLENDEVLLAAFNWNKTEKL